MRHRRQLRRDGVNAIDKPTLTRVPDSLIPKDDCWPKSSPGLGDRFVPARIALEIRGQSLLALGTQPGRLD